jgi:hypothetical protein
MFRMKKVNNSLNYTKSDFENTYDSNKIIDKWCSRYEKLVESSITPKQRAEEEKLKKQYLKWDKKSRLTNYSALVDLYDAIDELEYRIRSGAQSQLTGVDQDIDYVSCEPTISSHWRNGIPSGWWTCSIRIFGEPYGDQYAIQIDGNSWAGSVNDAYGVVDWYEHIPWSLDYAGSSGELKKLIKRWDITVIH